MLDNYTARACKYITRAVIGQYSGPDFPVMPTDIMSDVSWKSAGNGVANDLKVNEKRQYF